MRLPQDSVDAGIRATLPVAMETVLHGTGRVFLRGAGAGRLAVYGRPGAGLKRSLWTADSITAVAGGRLQNTGQREERFMDGEAVTKSFCKHCTTYSIYVLCCLHTKLEEKNNNTRPMQTSISVSPPSPDLIRAGRDPLLTSWLEGSAAGLQRCRSCSVASWDK